VGKIGIPDRVLLKPGKLDHEEREDHEAPRLDRRGDARRLAVRAPPARRGDRDARTTSAGTAAATRPAWRARRSRSPGGSAPSATSTTPSSRRARTRTAWSQRDALAEIASLSGRHFDPELVEAFLELWPDDVRPDRAAPHASAAAR
jgi:putative two-component system response regulator